MHWQKGWHTTGLLGIMAVCITAIQPVSLLMATAQTPATPPIGICTDEQRGQFLERLTRDLIDRSHQYARSGQLNLAARSLERALQIMPTTIDPFKKTDLVGNIAGTSGSQPSIMEQLVERAIATRQPDTVLALLPKVVQATQNLNGEYGVINTKRGMLVQLALYYTLLQQPNQARPLLDQAKQLLHSLPGDGFGLIATPVAEGYTQLGDHQTAIALLNQALQGTEAMKTNNLDYLSDIFSTIAIAYAKTGAEQPAIQTAQRIKVARVKAQTLAVIARHLTVSDSSVRANSLLTQTVNLTRTLPPAARADVLSTVALTYAQMGQWDTALKQVNQVTTAETKLRTLARLAAISDQKNRPEIAAKVLRDLATATKTIVPFYDGDRWLRQIFAEYLTNRHYGLALQFSQTLDATLQNDLLLQLVEQASTAGEFKIAQQTVAALPAGWNNQTRYLGWRAMATGYAQSGQYDQALQLLRQIEDTPDYPNQVLTRIAIAQAYAQTGQTAPALEQLNQALQASQKLGYSQANLQAMMQIAVQLARLRQMEQAIAVQTQILDIAKAPNPNAPSPSYWVEQLIRQYLQADQSTLALQLVQTLENEFEHDQSLQLVLQQMLEVGEWSAVSKMAPAIRNPNQKVAFWVKVADYYRGMGQPQQAVDILAQAFAIAQNLPGPDEKDHSAAHQIDPSVPPWDDFDRGSLLESIALRYADLDQHDAARQTAQTLQSSAAQKRLLQRLVCYQRNPI